MRVTQIVLIWGIGHFFNDYGDHNAIAGSVSLTFYFSFFCRNSIESLIISGYLHKSYNYKDFTWKSRTELRKFSI